MLGGTAPSRGAKDRAENDVLHNASAAARSGESDQTWIMYELMR